VPGNELEIGRFLLNSIGKIMLPHVGRLASIGAPNPGYPGFKSITTQEDINFLSSEDSRKKADIYINNRGVSLKQTGGSFSYNRLQRANLRDVYANVGFNNIEQRLFRIDKEVERFHQGLLDRRSRPWEDFFQEGDFKSLLEFLMMKGSPNVGLSLHPAEFILEAPPSSISVNSVSLYTFEEYFEKYKRDFKIAIRRQWIGQASDSEHRRAVSLAQKPGNASWVYEDIVGKPRTGWRSNFPKEAMRTVYFLMIEK